MKRWKVFVFLSWLLTLVLGVLVLWLSLYIPVVSPEWDCHVLMFLRTQPLFLGVVGIGLLYLLLWKVPKWQVTAVPEEKDRVDLEWKARQTIGQLIGGAVLLGGLYYTAQTLRISQDTL